MLNPNPVLTPTDLARDGRIWERGSEREREEAAGLYSVRANGEREGRGGEGREDVAKSSRQRHRAS